MKSIRLLDHTFLDSTDRSPPDIVKEENKTLLRDRSMQLVNRDFCRLRSCAAMFHCFLSEVCGPVGLAKRLSAHTRYSIFIARFLFAASGSSTSQVLTFS